MQTNINDIVGAFRKRKMPISAEYRPLYKISLILLILRIACIGGKASLNKFHFLIYALKSLDNRGYVKRIIENDDSLSIVSWGVEPALNKALVFAVAESLVEMKDGKYSITEKGTGFSKLIENDKDVLVEEKEFLIFIGKHKVTETFILKLTNKIAS